VLTHSTHSTAVPYAEAAACRCGRRRGVRRVRGSASIGRREARGAADPSDDNGVLEATQVAIRLDSVDARHPQEWLPMRVACPRVRFGERY